jgi:hypothetical protein
MDSCPILFGTIFIPWSLAYRYRGFWFGFWYSLHFNLLSFLRTSDEIPSSNLVLNLLFGIDNATELPENMVEQELQIRARFQLIMLLTAKDPLQQSISCLSDELSEACYRAQASPSSGKHLPLLAFRRTLANFGVQIAKAKEYATPYNHSFEYSQQPPKRSIASTFPGPRGTTRPDEQRSERRDPTDHRRGHSAGRRSGEAAKRTSYLVDSARCNIPPTESRHRYLWHEHPQD